MSAWKSARPGLHGKYILFTPEQTVPPFLVSIGGGFGREGSTLKNVGSGLSWASLLIAIGVYGLFTGIPFAVGFVTMILVHELGHLLCLWLTGSELTLPVSTPFEQQVQHQILPSGMATEIQAMVAFCGPFIGTLTAFWVYRYGLATHETLFMVLAFSGFLLNLFSLVPLWPMDGGRITLCTGSWIRWPAMVAVFIFATSLFHSLLLWVLVVGLFLLLVKSIATRHPMPVHLQPVSSGVRWMVSLAYFSLILFSGWFTVLSFHQLSTFL